MIANKKEDFVMKKELKEWLIAIIIAVLLLFLVNTFLIKSYTVSVLSMYPTFNNKDKVIVSKISKSLNRLDSGDVIVFHENKKMIL